MRRHLVLTGLPGSGKTTVGRKLAAALGAALTDLDETIELATGQAVSGIFATLGEPRFRALERSAMQGALDAPPHVVTPGGGWIAQQGNLEAARQAGALLVYLRVSPETAAARLAGSDSRPLLAGDRLGAIRQLLAEREALYLQADHVVDAEPPAEAVAEALRALLAGSPAAP